MADDETRIEEAMIGFDPFLLYPPQDDTHPEHPMWVRVEGHGAGWMRVIDMVHVRRASGCWTVQFPGIEEPLKVRTSMLSCAEEYRYEDASVLEYLDSEYPPVAPPCRIGQVWLISEGGGVAELAITSIMRVPGNEVPMVILPNIDPDGTIGHQVIGWGAPPANAIMVRGYDGPKVYTPPGWVRPTGAE